MPGPFLSAIISADSGSVAFGGKAAVESAVESRIMVYFFFNKRFFVVSANPP